MSLFGNAKSKEAQEAGKDEPETVEELQKAWRDPYIQWWAAGMPAFRAKNLEPWKQIKVKFKTKEDREAFGKVTGYTLTDKTNVVWYPEKAREKNMSNRFIEDES